MNKPNLKARLLELTQTIRMSEWSITSEIERLPWENEALSDRLRTDNATTITKYIDAAKDAAERLCAFFTTESKETKANDTSPTRNAVACIRNIATYLADVLAYTPDRARDKTTVVFDNIEQFLSEINGHVNTIRKELDIPEKVKVEPVRQEAWYAIVNYVTSNFSTVSGKESALDSNRTQVFGPAPSRAQAIDEMVRQLVRCFERATRIGTIYLLKSGERPTYVTWDKLITEWTNTK